MCRHILDHHSILSSLQHGFRFNRSCETQLLTTVHDLMKRYDSKNQIDVAILDFSKAFDKVPHCRLRSKLEHYGVTGKTCEWISEFLTNRTQSVLVEGESSSWTEVVSGVPQGTVLGPLLFLIFINDLPDNVTSQVRLFADDCLVYREVHSYKDQENLQKDLDALENWTQLWGMKFNPSKCTIMKISRKPPLNKFYSLGGEILKHVPDATYLGVTLTDNLNWSKHIDKVTCKANSTLGLLRRNLKKCPIELRELAYISLIRTLTVEIVV